MAKRLSTLAKSELFRKQGTKEKIADELGLEVRTIRTWIAKNKPNGKLTCDAVIRILVKELRLTKSELLEDVKNETPVKIRERKHGLVCERQHSI